MDRLTFLAKMQDKGRITKEQYENAVAKAKAVESAKAKYLDKKSSLTKTEMAALLDTLTV